MKYKAGLNSGKWKRKRLKILMRDGYKCTVCGSGKNLVVHHTYYTPNAKVWEYPDASLITLCNDCHYKYHCEHEIMPETATIEFNPYEYSTPRYRKKVNGKWVVFFNSFSVS
jgi:hypothetical protein